MNLTPNGHAERRPGTRDKAVKAAKWRADSKQLRKGCVYFSGQQPGSSSASPSIRHVEEVLLQRPSITKAPVIDNIRFNNPSSDTKLGRNVARTFLDYYKLNNHIKDNRPTHIQSAEVISPTGDSNNKGNGLGRDAEREREKEKSQGVRH
ncbi:hypothetical protein NQZ68_017130 [Dissostichus eleginoides]|nr:hypothetical protein NQZ68_017130 [Dissostichus eleginoides]